MRTKTDFDLVIVEGSKLGTKSDYNCRRKSRKNLNTLLENNIILAVRQKRKHILILSPISAHRQKGKTKSDFDGRT